MGVVGEDRNKQATWHVHMASGTGHLNHIHCTKNEPDARSLKTVVMNWGISCYLHVDMSAPAAKKQIVLLCYQKNSCIELRIPVTISCYLHAGMSTPAANVSLLPTRCVGNKFWFCRNRNFFFSRCRHWNIKRIAQIIFVITSVISALTRGPHISKLTYDHFTTM